jgi:hypothetical protein
MAARRNAVAIYARARANAANMGACAYTMFADMCTNPHAQYIYVCSNGIGSDGCEKCYREK